MEVRKYNRDSDYPTLVKWWKQWEFGVVPKEMLPVWRCPVIQHVE